MYEASILRKIAHPALPPAILYREHLVSTLKTILAQKSETPHRLVLLYAPAGYGKTTLLADFARHTHIPCCWYFFDHTDTDRAIFLRMLIESIRQHFSHFGRELDDLLSQVITVPADQQNDFYKAAVDTLYATITREITEQFIIILSDYHEVNESQTFTALMNYLIQHSPTHCSFVIESRTIPNIDFVSLLIHREMSGFSTEALRFSAQELCMLAKLQGNIALTEAKAEQLTHSFDGWITGILLGSYLGDIQGLGQAGREMGQKNLFAYVVHEVFKDIPTFSLFLQEASILHQMLPSICNALLAIEDAEERLQELERRGLFVTSSSIDNQMIYTCLPALRELFHEKLREQSPQRFLALHQRAAKLWGDLQDYDQGMYHALIAHSYDLATHFIIDAYNPMLKQGRIETILSWLDMLPTPILESQPRLLLIRTRITSFLGEPASVLLLLAQTTAALAAFPQEMSVVEREAVQTEIDILQSKAFFQMGKYQQAQLLCQQALEKIPASEVALRAEAYMRLGVCANLLGDPAAGLIHLQKALYLWGPRTIDSQVADIHGALGNTYSLIGNFTLAEHHLSCALDCCEQLHNERGKIDNLIRLGTAKIREDKPDEAEATYMQALHLARGPLAFQRGEAYALMNLGSLYLEQATYKQALVLIEDGLTLARGLGDKYLINCLLANLAKVYLLMGDPISATQLLAEMDTQLSQEDVVSYEFVQRELTSGLILLSQGRYDEAFACLTRIETPLNRAGLNREQIQAKLRLAACHVARHEEDAAANHIRALVDILNVYKGHKRLVLLELQRLPLLLYAVQTHRAMQPLGRLLGLSVQESEVEQPTSSPLLPVGSSHKLSLLAFGKPTVLIDDKPVTKWRMSRARELCFLLLNAEGPLTKDEVITALWEGEMSDTSDQMLYSIVHYLRKTLGDACIITREQSYQIDFPAIYGENVWYDVHAFLDLSKKAQAALKQKEDVEAKEALLMMLNLYRGDYVQSIYSSWCLARRDELRTICLNARRSLAQISWRQGQFEESIEHWQQILNMDDYLEDVHYELMRCYLHQDKRGLALRQYQKCEEVLQREFGIKPGPSIQNLFQQITKSQM